MHAQTAGGTVDALMPALAFHCLGDSALLLEVFAEAGVSCCFWALSRLSCLAA